MFLQSIAKHCLLTIRGTDLVARLGGEEFAFLLLHVNADEARAKMEKLRQEISELNVPYDGRKTLSVTVCIGLAMFTPQVKRFDELYIQADEKLYQAKNAGRNCVR